MSATAPAPATGCVSAERDTVVRVFLVGCIWQFTRGYAQPRRLPGAGHPSEGEGRAEETILSKGHHAGDDVGSCVIVTVPPAAVLANCTAVFRVPGGNITAQFAAIQGPTPKAIAPSGGTGNYRDIGGDGTLVEFGNGKGRLTLHVLSHIEEAD